MTNKMPYRHLTSREQAIFARLLEVDFPGRDALAKQIDGALVSPIDEWGSLKITAITGEAAPVARRVPIEAETEDKDGVTIHVLLHVVSGRVSELELYKNDLSPVRHPLDPAKLRVVLLD